MSVAATTCTAAEAFCVCTLPADDGHAAHVCECGGSWEITPDGGLIPHAWPGLLSAPGLMYPVWRLTTNVGPHTVVETSGILWTEDFGQSATADLWIERLCSALVIAAALTLADQRADRRSAWGPVV
jgi:hypothetical protein